MVLTPKDLCLHKKHYSVNKIYKSVFITGLWSLIALNNFIIIIIITISNIWILLLFRQQNNCIGLCGYKQGRIAWCFVVCLVKRARYSRGSMHRKTKLFVQVHPLLMPKCPSFFFISRIYVFMFINVCFWWFNNATVCAA